MTNSICNFLNATSCKNSFDTVEKDRSSSNHENLY